MEDGNPTTPFPPMAEYYALRVIEAMVLPFDWILWTKYQQQDNKDQHAVPSAAASKRGGVGGGGGGGGGGHGSGDDADSNGAGVKGERVKG